MNTTRLSLLSRYDFLSCLCGSERAVNGHFLIATFLSCLCGSEQYFERYNTKCRFLSCLCGSERFHNQPNSLIFEDE